MAPATHQTVVALVKFVVVVVEVVHGHHALAVVLVNLAVDTVRLDAADVGIILQPYLVGHKLHHLHLDALALGIHGQLLHVAGVLAEFLIAVFVGTAATFLIAGEQTVHHGVGITPYGAGKVGVIVESQSVVAYVVHTVARLHHGPQGHGLYQVLLLGAGTLLHERVEALGEGSFGARRLELVAELDHKLAQGLQFGGVGHVVHTVRQRLGLDALLHTSHTLGHGAVGQEHELLDELVGVFRHLEVAACGLACLVHVEVEFLALKLHGAVLEALGTEQLGESVERDELAGQLALVAALAGRGCRLSGAVHHPIVFQYLLHLLIGKAPTAPYHGMYQSPALHLRLIVHLKHRAEAQLVLVGPQRADVVAEALGQHGDGTVYEIDAGGPFLRLLVDDGALLHIVRHIGYVHAHLPEAVVELAYGEGIVEVLGIVRVDGEGAHAAEVLASLQVGRGDFGAYLIGGLLHMGGILIGQSVLGQDGMHLDRVLARLAQHVDHFAHNVFRLLAGPLCNLDHRLVARDTILELLLGYHDVVDEDVALGDEESKVALHHQFSHKGVAGVGENLRDHRLLDMVAPACVEGHPHPVAVEGEHRVALRHEHGFSAVVGQEAVLSVGLAPEDALLHLPLEIEAVGAVAHLAQHIVPGHFLQGVDAQHLERMGVELQCAEYLFQRERLVGLFLKESDERLGELPFVHSFAFFSFCHSIIS